MKAILITKRPSGKYYIGILLAIWLLILAFPSSATAQYKMDWVTQFGTTADEYDYAAASDADGYVLVGFTQGSLPGFSNQGNLGCIYPPY